MRWFGFIPTRLLDYWIISSYLNVGSERIRSPGGVKVDDDQLGPGGLELRLEVRLVFDLVHHLVVLSVHLLATEVLAL